MHFAATLINFCQSLFAASHTCVNGFHGKTPWGVGFCYAGVTKLENL